MSARQAALIRKAEREVAAFGDRLAEAGFVRDEQRPDLFVRTERDAELGQGCIALWNRVLDEPVRWQVEPMFGWRLPEVDAVRAEVDGPRRSLDPTIVESLFVAKYPELRHSGDDTSEFRPGSDPGRSLRIWTGLAVEGWPWWSGQFSDLDSFFDYLHLNLRGGVNNLETGYLLALLTERPEMATDFVRHMFARRWAVWAQEPDYNSLVDALSRYAAVIGAPTPPLPAFAELNAVVDSIDQWPALEHPLLTELGR